MTDPSPRTTLTHLPGLDGLRGLAVLGVLLFHDGRLAGGYLGVDLFFVLSGYLITSLLLAEWRRHGRIGLGAFWARRARRLFPALLVLVPFVALYALYFANLGELDRIRREGLATLAYVANWQAIYAGDGYWDLFEAPSPFEHTWSLAIEEQFYVVWPLLCAWVLRRRAGDGRAVAGVAAMLALASGAAMVLLADPATGSDRAYFGTDTRGVAILVGCVLACGLPPGATTSPVRMRGLDLLGALALVGLGASWWQLHAAHPWLYRGAFFATQIAVLAVIACVAHGEASRVGKLLAFAPLRWLGLASYGIYLWHWPIFVWLSPERLGLTGLALSSLRLGVTLGVAAASYFWIEQPIRRKGFRVRRPVPWVLASFSGAALLIFATTLHSPKRTTQITALPTMSSFPPGSTSVLVVGDSVAQAMGERMQAAQAGTHFVVVERGNPHCSILEGTVPTMGLNKRPHTGGDCDATWLPDAQLLEPDIMLVVLGGGHFAPIEVEGRWRNVCDPAFAPVYQAELEARLAELGAHVGTLWFTRIPYGGGRWNTPDYAAWVDCFNDLAVEAASRVPGTRILDLGAYVCPAGSDSCRIENEHGVIRPDGLHFKGEAALGAARWVLAQFR